MTTLDGVPLFDLAAPASGGAFRISGTAHESLAADVPGGWAVSVAAGGRYVVARKHAPVGGYEQARDEGLQAAQQGLDLFCIGRAADLAVRDADAEHLAWWPEPCGQVLRLTDRVTICPDLSVTATVTDPAGNVQAAPPRPAAVWHECLRYFRLAQVTDDLFDAYRNLFLALEAVLDRVAPQAVGPTGKPAEREGDWLRRALGEADKLVGLGRFAPAGSADPAGDLFDELYVRSRTALFHAKTSRASLLPHSPGGGRDGVAAAVARLSGLVMALCRAALGTSSATGGFTQAGFAAMADRLIGRLRLHVTDDPAATPDAAVANPSGGVVVALATRPAPELDGVLLRTALGAATGEDLAGLGRIAAIVATLDGRNVAVGPVVGELVLGGVARLEVQLGLGLRNRRMARRDFAS